MSGVVRVYVVVLAIVLMSGVASAATHTVCASGCDFSTIQAAVTAANSYDTVYVWNGTYTENIDIATAHLTLEGEGRDVVTVNAAVSSDHVFDVTANYVNISGFNFTGTSGYYAGVYHSSNFCNIFNNSFKNASMGVYGIGKFSNISYNRFEAINKYGIFLWGGVDDTISNNRYIYVERGISLESVSGAMVFDNVIDTGISVLTSDSSSGIEFTSGTTMCKAINNTISYFSAGIILAFDTTNNTIQNNTISSCEHRGMYVYDATNNTFCGNNLNYNPIAMYFRTTSIPRIGENYILNNAFENNFNSIIDTMPDNKFSENHFADNVNIMYKASTHNRTIVPNQEIDFNVYVNHSNGTPSSSVAINNIIIEPSEDISYTTNGNEININFTPSRSGLYSLVLNATDDLNNAILQRFYFGNASVVKYYIHPDTNPTHGQPGRNWDARTWLLTQPTADSSFYCSGWVQACPDEIPSGIDGVSRILSMDIFLHYITQSSIAGVIGIKRNEPYILPTIEYGSYLPPTSGSLISQTESLSVSWWLYNPSDWYWFSIKIDGEFPQWHTFASNPSYANITYLYTTTPTIKSISNEDILLLSATSPAGDNTSASIVLDGEGTTNLTVQMPNTALTYTATYDGNPCSDAACSFTQSAGELNFSLALGSEHTIEITEEDGDNSTYATHLSAVTPGTAGNSITTTTTCADASFGAATLTGGSDSDSEWAGSDIPTGVDIWRDGAGMIAIVVLALLAGVVIVFLRGSGVGTGITISPNVAIGLAVGLLVLLAVFSIAPIFGDRIDSVSDLGRETHATGRLSFVLDGTTADGETVTIDATTLEFDRSADGVTAGRIPVNISDGTAATASLNLTAAINGNATLAGVVTARRDIS